MPSISEIWTGLVQQPWLIRMLIGAIVGGFLFVVVPAITGIKSNPTGGGAGGSAKVVGSGTAIGGKGGGGGPNGPGGAGGAAEVNGDGFALGGEGGEAGQADRGGRGGRSPVDVLEEMGLANDTTRQIRIFQKLANEFIAEHPEKSEAIHSGKEQLPDEWTNQRLRAIGYDWHYTSTENGYRLEQLK
ncbi:hypothetical protein [Bradyrhizobium sp. 26S5]|uniref:hypothetical protein n=1 Tax=Bradyrhizobium sp. 26S5 TaxID=3139729 RepID=UPI0030D02996